MELLQLKYFCNAAETENLSKTAKKYLVPTSNISQSIKRLEKELGCELFEHSTNKITLKVVVDTASVEVFVNGGILAMTTLAFPRETGNGVSFVGNCMIEQLDIWDITV